MAYSSLSPNLDSKSEEHEDEDRIHTSTGRKHKRRHSAVTPADTNSNESLAGLSRNELDDGKERTQMSQRLDSGKRRHGKIDPTAETRVEVEQPSSADGPSSAESLRPPTALKVPPNPIGQSSSTSSMHASPLSSTTGKSIDANKQNNTTLWISIPSSSDAVPVKLRSCMTVSSLFDSVFATCGLAEQDARRSGLRTSLGWKPNSDVVKSLVLKRDFEDSFKIFLEMIDALPCWEQESGRCYVTVEVVMA